GKSTGDSSQTIRQRVEHARSVQRRRFARMKTVACNAFVSGRWLDSHGRVHHEARELLQTAAERLSLSARGYHRVLKVARTIADLERSDEVAPPHGAGRGPGCTRRSHARQRYPRYVSACLGWPAGTGPSCRV